jgi:hypothetical protein
MFDVRHAQQKTRMCDGSTHRILEAQNASTAVSTDSFKTLDDDQ